MSKALRKLPDDWVFILLMGGLTVVLLPAAALASEWLEPHISPAGAIIAMFLATAVVLVIAFTRLLRKGRRIRNKIVMGFFLVALLPLDAGFLVSRFLLENTITGNYQGLLRSSAEQVAARIDAFIENNLADVRTSATLPVFSQLLLAAPGNPGRGEYLRQAGLILKQLQRKDHLHISSIALLDRRGWPVIDTFGEDRHPDKSDRLYFRETWSSEMPYVSPVLLSPATGKPSIYFSALIRDENGVKAGLLRVRFHISVLQRIIFESRELLGPDTEVLLADELGIRLADSLFAGRVYRPVQPLPPDRLEQARRDRRHVLDYDAGAGFTAEAGGAMTNCLQHRAFRGRLNGPASPVMMASTGPLKKVPWTVICGFPQERIGEAVQTLLLWSCLILVLMTVLLSVCAAWLARSLAAPVLRLTSAAETLAAGNLDLSLEPGTRDEIGRLTATFNSMTAALASSRREIELSRKRMALLLDAIPDAVIVHDREGHILEVNRGFVMMYGYELDCLASIAIEHLSGAKYTQAMAKEKLEQAFHQQLADFEWVARHRGGHEFPVLVRLRRMNFGEEEAIIAVVTDITERKRVEVESLKIQKLEAVGLLAGGIAHDFNNILTAVVGNISLARMVWETGEKNVGQYLADTETALERARNLTQQLLTFARGGAPVKTTTRIEEIVEESVRFMLSGSNIGCQFTIPGKLWAVEVDEGQFNQVLNNLVINAMQAMPDGGMLHVALDNAVVDENSALPVKPGRYLRIRMRDEGMGIPAGVLPFIFDPFFSTKAKGSGLGLTTSFSIMRRHDGHIAVESEPGRGATFTIYLPASNRELAVLEPSGPEIQTGLTGRVLLMDDETLVRTVASKMLTMLGLTVDCAEEGWAAVEMCRQALAEGKRYDLVIMDLTVPGGMGGKDAARLVLQMDPEIPVVVSSGYSNDPVMAGYQQFGFRGAVKKPFNLAELSALLSLLLPHSKSN